MDPASSRPAARDRAHLETWRRCLDRETAHPRLSYLFWEATRACMLSCRHCGTDCGAGADRSRELSGDEAAAALEGVARDFGAPGVFLAVSGGEPLARPDLFEVTGRAARLGFAWGLVTNGWAADGRVVEACRRTGLQSLAVSLDGAAAATHDGLRGVAGSFDRALEAIDRFRAAGFLRHLQVATAVHPGNLDELPALHDLLAARGVREWRVVSVFPGGRALRHPDLLLSPDGMGALMAFLGGRRSRPGPVRVAYGDGGFLGIPHERRVRDSWYACLAGVRIAAILADGTLSGCLGIPRSLDQGNVRRQSVKDAWENGFGPYRDRSWMRRGPCGPCDDFDACRGNSLHLLDAEAGGPRVCHRDLLRRAGATVPGGEAAP